MSRSKHFTIGSEVSANDFSGRKIIGIYRGPHNTFGVWIYGFPWGEDPKLELHHCTRLTMQLRAPEAKTIKRSAILLEKGQPCTALTRQGENIYGLFIQPDGPKFAWIKTSKGMQKVIRSSIQKHA